jgi:hypothetical protein
MPHQSRTDKGVCTYASGKADIGQVVSVFKPGDEGSSSSSVPGSESVQSCESEYKQLYTMLRLVCDNERI